MFSIFLVSFFSAGGGAISNGIQPAITHLYGNNLKSGKYRIPLKFYFCRCILPPKSNSPFPADEETDSISGSHNLTSPSLDRTSHSNSLKGPRLLFAAGRYDHTGVLLLIFVQQAHTQCGLLGSKVMLMIFLQLLQTVDNMYVDFFPSSKILLNSPVTIYFFFCGKISNSAIGQRILKVLTTRYGVVAQWQQWS